MAFTDAQLSDMREVWYYYRTYPYQIKNNHKMHTIKYFVEQVYAWALYVSGKVIPARIVLEPGLRTKVNIGQVIAYMTSSRGGIRLVKAISPIPRGAVISRIQKALH